jgi:rod shape-determining protein MreC
VPPYVPPQSAESDARRQRFVTLAFIAAALVLSYLPSGGQEAIASGLRSSVLRPFLGLQSVVVATRERTLDVRLLQARLDSATARLLDRTTLDEENARLRALLDLQARAPGRWLAGQVLRPGTQGSESTFLINLGADDGVPPRAPVVTPEGLAGVVREVRAGSSIGMDWTHPDFRPSGMSIDGAVYGIVETRRGLFREEDRLLLSGTPYHTLLDPGTEIVTSGIGGVYPRGIPIGRVVEVAESEGGWTTSYWVEPFVAPGDMVQVLVMFGADSTTVGAGPSRMARSDSASPGPPDVSAVWPLEERGTRVERRNLEQARLDSMARLTRSVEALRDSVQRLRARPDSGGGGP